MKQTILLLLISLIASAETPGTVDLKASIGYAGFTDESLINHLQTGASARFYVTRRLSIEPEFQYLRQSENHSDVVLVPNVTWDFRESRVVPYVTGGVGWVHSQFRQFRPPFSVNETFWHGGGGVKLYFTDRWFVAPEARFGWELHFRASIAVGYTLRR